MAEHHNMLTLCFQALKTADPQGYATALQLLRVPNLDHRMVNIMLYNTLSGFGICKHDEEILSYLEIIWIICDQYCSIVDDKILTVLLHALVSHSHMNKPCAVLRLKVVKTLYDKLDKLMFQNLLPGILKFLTDNVGAYCGQNLKSTLKEAMISLELLNRIIPDMFHSAQYEKYTPENKHRIQKVIRFNVNSLLDLTKDQSEVDSRLCKTAVSFIEILLNHSYLIDSYQEDTINLLITLQTRTEQQLIFIDSIYKDTLYKLATQAIHEINLRNELGRYEIRYINVIMDYLDTDIPYFIACYTDKCILLINKLTEISIPAVAESKFHWKQYLKYIKSTEMYSDLKLLLQKLVNWNILEELQFRWTSVISQFLCSPSVKSALNLVQLFICLQDVEYPEYWNTLYDTVSFTHLSADNLKDVNSLKFIINSLRVKQIESDLQLLGISNPMTVFTQVIQIYQEGFKGDMNYLLQLLIDLTEYKSVSDLINTNQAWIFTYIKDSIKLYDLECIAPSIYYLLDSSQFTLLPDILVLSFYKLDTYVKTSNIKKVLSYCRFYRLLAHYMHTALNLHIFKDASSTRQLLLRFKPFLCYTRHTNKYRRLAQEVIGLFIDYIPIMSNAGIEYDPLNNSTFSVEEENNVTIPKALPAISYEFLPSWVFCLKTAVNSQSDEVIRMVCELVSAICNQDSEFWSTSSRFEESIYPFFKIYSRQNRKEGKYLQTVASITFMIESLPASCTSHILQDWYKYNTH